MKHIFLAGVLLTLLVVPVFAQTPEINMQRMIILQLGQQGAPLPQIAVEQEKLNAMIRDYNAKHPAVVPEQHAGGKPPVPPGKHKGWQKGKRNPHRTEPYRPGGIDEPRWLNPNLGGGF